MYKIDIMLSSCGRCLRIVRNVFVENSLSLLSVSHHILLRSVLVGLQGDVSFS